MTANLAQRQPSIAEAPRERWLIRLKRWVSELAHRVQVLPRASVAQSSDSGEVAQPQYHEARNRQHELDDARAAGRSAILFRRESREDELDRPSVSLRQSADDSAEQFTPVDRGEFYSHLPGGTPSGAERGLAPAATTTSASVIAADAIWTGTLVTSGSVQVLGVVNGERIEAQRLEVAQGASVRATVIAGSCMIAGAVEGSLDCRERLAIAASGNVRGSVTAGTLVVEEGALIAGDLRMRDSLVHHDDPAVVDSSVNT
jgi:cytoskeletal protein CcmA (bactofilin family)